MKTNRLQAGIIETTSRWNKESKISAIRAHKSGRTAKLVVYPSGLRMMRFAEPFTDHGMHYEVPESVWSGIVHSKNGNALEECALCHDEFPVSQITFDGINWLCQKCIRTADALSQIVDSSNP